MSERFLDDDMLRETSNVWRSLHHPAKQKENPLLEPDKPWEGYLVLQPGTVIYDQEDDCFKMWYNAQPSCNKPDAGHNLCYAVSQDGVHWQKPELGLTEYNGSRANNILLQGILWTHCVLKDTADPDTDRRFKLLYWAKPYDGPPGIYAAVSTDGIHWEVCKENPCVPKEITGDTFSVMRDPESGQYWLFHKTPAEPIRTVSRMVSDDFIHWGDSRRALAPDQFDPPDTQFYGLSAFPYGNQFAGFLWVYHTYQQTMDMQVVTSRDGLHWERTANRKLLMHLIPTNNYQGNAFDSTMIYPCSAPVEKDGRLWLFYSGFTVPHNAPAADHDGCIGLATLRAEGICSLDATSRGIVRTPPFQWHGVQLRLNAETYGLNNELSPAAKAPVSRLTDTPGIRVQIEDQDGYPFPEFIREKCKTFSGNATDAVVAWEGQSDLRKLKGETVQLLFEMSYAKLYAWKGI